MKTGLLYGIVACSKTRVRCILCGVFIPKASRCIEQHLNGARHKESIDLMNENGITYLSDALYCRPCVRSLHNEECVIKHIDSEDHANWMAAVDDLVDGEFITLDSYLSCEKDDIFCEVCNTQIVCTLKAIEEHVNSVTHRTNITERLKPLNGIFAANNQDEVWCKVCHIYFDNTIRNILSHIDDDEHHMEWFTEIEDTIEEQEITIESYLSNEHEVNAYCKKCHVEMLCNVQSIRNHINSDGHLDRMGL